MESNTKKPRWRLNVFDIVIIAVVLAAAAALLLIWRGSGKSSKAVVDLKPITYTIELDRMEAGTAEKIKIGDTIYDGAKKYIMGTVVSVTVKPSQTAVKDLENGNVLMEDIPGKETALVTLTCSASETDAQITAESGYIIRVGEKVQAAGPGYAGLGYIVIIDREEAAQ
jgi:hypothetical protein